MLKKRIAPVVLSAALLGTLAVGGVAGAAAPATTATATAPSAKHPGRTWLKANRKEIRKAVVTISASTIGITPAALVTDLKSGKSIAQVAYAHSVSAQTVDVALTKAADAKVAEAVAAGKLTKVQGDKIDARLPIRIAKLVNHVF
jgi:hypothetical protein